MAVAVERARPSVWSRPRVDSITRSLRRPAVLALAVVAAAWIVTFAVLVVRRHDGFWDVDFDMGIHDQSVWLVAHGRGVLTGPGLPGFRHPRSVGVAARARPRVHDGPRSSGLRAPRDVRLLPARARVLARRGTSLPQ